MFALVKIKVGEELVPLTHITSYKVQEIDVDGDGAGTTEDGTTIRDVRRRNKSKITLKLEGLSLEEYKKVKTIRGHFFCGNVADCYRLRRRQKQ